MKQLTIINLFIFAEFSLCEAIQSFGMCPLKKLLGKGLECRESGEERQGIEKRVGVSMSWTGEATGLHAPGEAQRYIQEHVRRCTIWNGEGWDIYPLTGDPLTERCTFQSTNLWSPNTHVHTLWIALGVTEWPSLIQEHWAETLQSLQWCMKQSVTVALKPDKPRTWDGEQATAASGYHSQQHLEHRSLESYMA